MVHKGPGQRPTEQLETRFALEARQAPAFQGACRRPNKRGARNAGKGAKVVFTVLDGKSVNRLLRWRARASGDENQRRGPAVGQAAKSNRFMVRPPCSFSRAGWQEEAIESDWPSRPQAQFGREGLAGRAR